MARFGSSGGYLSDNLSATTDSQGNPVISPDNSFAASPLGYAARAQALYGIANPTFNLTPPDSLGTISSANQLPYWETNADGDIIPTMYFDSATETWDVDLNPSGAGSGATINLKTRSFLLNDTNLSLRQKAYLTLTKNGSFSGTAQWQVTLGAEYFTYTGTSLGSYAIGTVSHSSTWTSISGTTTSGGTAIDASAYYVDLSVKMTALGTVTDTTTVRLNSLLLATSQATTGSFLVSQTFTSSGTWTRPTGVNYVSVLAVGAGGGGGCGGAGMDNVVGGKSLNGGGVGGAGAFVIARDLYVGDQTTVSVGVGSGGNGGAAATAAKASLTTTAPINATLGTATAGGNSTFGSFVTAGGGAAGSGNSASGATGGTATSILYGATLQNGAAAGLGTSITKFPFVSSIGTGVAGSSGTQSISGTSATTRVYLATGAAAGTTYANSGAGGAGGGGAVINIYSTGGTARVTYTATSVGGSGAFGMFGAGGSGGPLQAGSATAIAGPEVSPTVGSGGGGGGGGAAISDRFTGAGSQNQYRDAAATAIGAAGASGGAGFVTVVYTA